MRELTAEEIAQVSGAGMANDSGKWVGDQLGYLYNQIRERLYNAPFERVYQ